MIPLSVSHAAKVYEDAFCCEIIRHSVDHPGLAELSRSILSVIHSLGDDVTDEYWRQTIGPIRRLGLAFCSTPLPFARVANSFDLDWNRLRRQVRRCQQLFPDSHAQLVSLLQQLEELSGDIGSPFIEPLEILHERNDGLSVVLRNACMNKSVSTFFAESATLKNATVVSPSQLRGAHLCNALVTVGPCGWFPEYVFTAPRAAVVHVISPSWIRDSWRPGPIFIQNSEASGENNFSHRIGTLPKISSETFLEDRSSSDIISLDLVQPLPVLRNNELPYVDCQARDSVETVPARLCHLSGSRSVYVAANDHTSLLIIDSTELDHAIVRRTPVCELETGQYLILRTSGGGDFITPLADHILGDLALQRRSEQIEWKERLISEATERFGKIGRRELSARVASELQLRSLSGARAANVYYWMSSKCIRPRKIEDFVAILSFAGLQGRSEELWSAMGDIDRAHKQAGHHIRQILLRKIKTASLELLQRDGEMIFDLGDHDGGTLSAFQIVTIVKDDFEVPIDRIGVLMEIEV